MSGDAVTEVGRPDNGPVVGYGPADAATAATTDRLSRFFASEVAGLAPWVAAHLDLLADVLGLRVLSTVRAESPVGPFRLDLLARGACGDGVEVPVAVEVQLGGADHDHLGKLVTYLAHEGRGHGVWVVDSATHPHLVAVDFLNRSTPGDISWWLVCFRQDGGEAPDLERVCVDVLAGPGVALPPAPVRPEPTGHRSHGTRTAFLEEILAATSGPALRSGWRNPRITNKGFAVTYGLPAGAVLARTSVKVRAHADRADVHLLVQGHGEAGNQAVIDALRERHGEGIRAAIHADAVLRWHAAQKRADSLVVSLPGHGWEGETDRTAAAVLACLAAFSEAVVDPALLPS